jgi:hypothetical protein
VFNIANFWGNRSLKAHNKTFKDSVYIAALLTKTMPLINKLVASRQIESVQSELFRIAQNYTAQDSNLVMIRAIIDSCLLYYILHLQRLIL